MRSVIDNNNMVSVTPCRAADARNEGMITLLACGTVVASVTIEVMLGLVTIDNELLVMRVDRLVVVVLFSALVYERSPLPSVAT